MSDKVR